MQEQLVGKGAVVSGINKLITHPHVLCRFGVTD